MAKVTYSDTKGPVKGVKYSSPTKRPTDKGGDLSVTKASANIRKSANKARNV